MALLNDEQITAGLESREWRHEGETLVRDWRFADFGAAIAFVERVAELAEASNHHPDILVHGWNKVRLTLSTHSEGGVTAADLALAQRLDTVG
jgi:4a-hydroxytetrahydrobiopterin dehydratase